MGKSDKEQYEATIVAAYKKIMDIAFHDPATDDVEDSEMED